MTSQDVGPPHQSVGPDQQFHLHLALDVIRVRDRRVVRLGLIHQQLRGLVSAQNFGWQARLPLRGCTGGQKKQPDRQPA
jgi:hypothetical protein